jgi:quinol monooxygenase YgiN
MLMPTISKDNKCVTLINTFTVEPSNQQKLLDLLIEATETSVRHKKGFISASFHRSLDGTKITAYAQWQSVEDYQEMRKQPSILGQALSFSTFESGMYEVAETFSTN